MRVLPFSEPLNQNSVGASTSPPVLNSFFPFFFGFFSISPDEFLSAPRFYQPFVLFPDQLDLERSVDLPNLSLFRRSSFPDSGIPSPDRPLFDPFLFRSSFSSSSPLLSGDGLAVGNPLPFFLYLVGVVGL